MISLYFNKQAYLSMQLSAHNGTQVWNCYPGTWLILLSPLKKSENLMWSGKWSPCIWHATAISYKICSDWQHL